VKLGRFNNFLALLFLLIGSGVSAEENDRPADYIVRAQFIVAFADYFSWPSTNTSDSSERINICLYGESDIRRARDIIRTQSKRRTFDLVEVKSLKGIEAKCHFLYIGKSEEDRLDAVIASLEKIPVLTVSDIDSFIDYGGMIGFVLVEQEEALTVKFAVNARAIRQAGFSIKEAGFLDIAHTVKR
jgi:hypothetical protein